MADTDSFVIQFLFLYHITGLVPEYFHGAAVGVDTADCPCIGASDS